MCRDVIVSGSWVSNKASVVGYRFGGAGPSLLLNSAVDRSGLSKVRLTYGDVAMDSTPAAGGGSSSNPSTSASAGNKASNTSGKNIYHTCHILYCVLFLYPVISAVHSRKK